MTAEDIEMIQTAEKIVCKGNGRVFVSVDKVLELIDELNDIKTLVKANPIGGYLHETYARRLKEAVKELTGERPEGND